MGSRSSPSWVKVLVPFARVPGALSVPRLAPGAPLLLAWTATVNVDLFVPKSMPSPTLVRV